MRDKIFAEHPNDMKRLYLLIVFCFTSWALHAQVPTVTWANAIGGTGEDIIQAIATDPSGNVFIAGSFNGTVDFDPGSGVTNATAAGLFSDAFVAKYNSAGVFQWVNTWGSSGDYDEVRAVVADASFVYVTGDFRGTATDFDDTAGSTPRTTVGGSDIFLAKFATASGAVTWVNTFGSTSGDFGTGVALDATGNVYMSANFQGLNVDFDPAGTQALRSSLGLYDMILAKYSSNGSFIWATALGSSGEDFSTAVYLNGTGVWIAGSYSNTFQAEPTIPSLVATNDGGTDGYFGQYSASAGVLLWGSTINSTLDDNVTSVWTDGTNLLTAGTYKAPAIIYGDNTQLSLATPVGGSDGWMARYTLSNHELVWASNIGSVNDDYLNWMTSDGTNMYIVGAYQGQMDIDPLDETSYILAQTGGFDAFYAKYAVSSGALLGGFGAGGVNGDEGTCIVVDASTNIYYSGIFTDNIDVDGSAGVVSKTGNVGLHDGFFVKYASGTPEPVSPATSLVFDQINTTSYDYDFTGSPGVAGHVAIRKIGSPPSFVPKDGFPLTQGTTNTEDGSVVDYVGTAVSLTVTSALPNTTYYYAIYPFNGSGNAINYKQATPLTGDVTTEEFVSDAVAPVIVNNTVATVAPNASIKVTATITDNIGIADAYVEFYPINTGESGYGYGDLVQTGTTTTWEFTIASSFNTEQGVEYNIYVYDAAGNSASTGWKQVLVAHSDDGLTIVSGVTGTAKTDYRIVSVPLDLAKKSVNDIFSDDIGPLDKKKFRMFKYENKTLSELTSSSSIEIGRGYWFLATDVKPVDSGPGTTVNAGIGKPFTIPIVEGWNLIGNPLNSNIPWSLIADLSDNDDVTMGPLRVYNKRWDNGTTLQKFSGGFVMVTNDGDGVLRIPVTINDRIVAPTPENFARTLDSDIWAVEFSLKSGETTNTFGGFGMHPNASEQNDRYDDYTLPRFMEYLELNYNKKIFGSAFTKDIVPTTDRHTWEFQVESNLSEEVIELTWDNSFFGTSDRHLVLWDIDQQRAIDMRTEKSYAFQRGQSGAFKVFFGDESFVKAETLPYRPVFHSASPVPSSGNVTLAFSVPEASGQVNTNISIYNLMGQKVANLLDKPLQGGYQQAVWNIEDGTKPASGMYISVLKFGDFTLQKRLIIK